MPRSQRAEAILEVLGDRPVAYHPRLAEAIGVKEAVFICQLLYWDGKGKDREGWIFKRQEEWADETGLSYSEQKTTRRRLIALGLIEEKLRGIPATLHFRLRFDRLSEIIDLAYPETPADQSTEVPQTCLRKSRNQFRRKPVNLYAEAPQSIPESTPESTPRNTQESTPEITFGANAPHPDSKNGNGNQQQPSLLTEDNGTPSSLPVPPPPSKKTPPPAVAVFRELIERYPPKTAWGDLEKVEDLEYWGQIVKSWSDHGWNKLNVAGMLAFYWEHVSTDRALPSVNGGKAQSVDERNRRILQAAMDKAMRQEQGAL